MTIIPKIIAKLWDRTDGTVCLLGKNDGVWFIRMERQGEMIRESAVSSAKEGVDMADEWHGGDRRRPRRVAGH